MRRTDDDSKNESSSDGGSGDDRTIRIESPAASESSLTVGSPDRETVVLGTRLGRYRIVAELGRGGQATVFLAIDEQLGREVALKVLPLGMQAPAVLKRFQREAAIVSRLDDPGICAIYDAGISEGQAYIAMQYLRGPSFRDWLQHLASEAEVGEHSKSATGSRGSRQASSGRKLTDRILAAIEKVARSLHAAHEAGVVHRDIKSANIMMTEGDRPVIVDFGLARASDLQHETLTISGDLFGTPLYMSPEQVRGEPLDARTDVYSLGVVLYEALTGRRPHMAATREALYRAILAESATSLRSIRPELSNDLEVIVATAMEKDLKRRYQSAEALADDIGRARRHEVIRAKPVPAWFRFWRLCQRNPLASSLTALIFVLLAVGLVLAMAQNRELERRREASERAAYRAQIAAAHAAFRGGDAETLRYALAAVEPSRRGWEWRYLAARPTEPLARFDLGMRLGDAVSLVRDDRFVWLGGSGDRLVLVDAERGEVVRVLETKLFHGPFSPSPDGKSILLGLRGGELMLIDAETAEPLWPAPVRGTINVPGCFAPGGGEILVRGGADRVIATETGEELRRLPRLTATAPSNCQFVTDDLIVSRSDGNPRAAARFCVHDARDGEVLQSHVNFGGLFKHIVLDQLRGRVLIASTAAGPEIAARGLPKRGNFTTVFDLRNDRRLLDRVALPNLGCLVGEHAVACLIPGGIEVRDLRTAAVEVRMLTGVGPTAPPVAACGGKRLIQFDVEGRVYLWKTWRTESPWTAGEVGWGVALSERGDRYAWSNWSIVHVRDAQDGRLLWEHNFPIRRVVGFAFSPDGTRLGVGDEFGVFYEFDATTGELLAESPRMGGKDREVLVLAWLPDGATMVAADITGRIFSWRRGQDRPRDLARFDRKINALAPADGGAQILVALGHARDGSDSSGALATVDVATGEPRALVAHPSAVTAVIEARGLARHDEDVTAAIISGDESGLIQLRSPRTLAAEQEIVRLGSEVAALDWGAEIERLLAGAELGLSVIDLRDRAEVLTISTPWVSRLHYVPERDAVVFTTRVGQGAFGALETRQGDELEDRRILQARANGLVASLIDEAPLVVDARAALDRLDPDLDPELRRAAEETLDHLKEAAAWLNSDGWGRGIRRDLAQEEYAAALRVTRRASELVPDCWPIINTRSQLLYRCELYEECLESIAEGVALYQAAGREGIDSHDRLIRAMALARLGRMDEARAEFRRSLADWDGKEDANLRREALELIPLPQGELPPSLVPADSP